MKKLPEKYYRFFEEAGRIYHIYESKILYMQGDNVANIYFIKSGRVRMFYIGANGKEITYQIVGEGQMIGEAAFLSHTCETTVRAVTDSVLISCPVKSLFPYMKEHEELNVAVLELLADNYQYLCSHLRRLTMFDSIQKVAGFLLEHTKTDNTELGIINHTLPYTHEELAVCLNLNRVTVTKILKRLADEGAVVLHYRKIQVINREVLERHML